MLAFYFAISRLLLNWNCITLVIYILFGFLRETNVILTVLTDTEEADFSFMMVICLFFSTIKSFY